MVSVINAIFFYRPFPTEESVDDEDIYKGLPDLIEYVVNILVTDFVFQLHAIVCIML